MTRTKLADLTSGVGALVLGVGLGAFFATVIGPLAGFITLVGVAVHGFGMWDKHRLEARGEADNNGLVLVLYWVCWLMLGGVLLYTIA